MGGLRDLDPAVTALLVVGLLLTTASPAPPAARALVPAARVPAVLVLTPGLDWSNAPAQLRRGHYARANVSVRTAHPRGTPADGYLTIGAGARALAPKDLGVGRVAPDGTGLRLLDWKTLRRQQRDEHTAARLGSLGEQLRAGGRSWALAGDDERGAAAAADASGRVPVVFRAEAGGVMNALRSEVDVVVVATSLAQLPAVLEDADASARCVMVASASTRDKGRHLGAFASRACGLAAGGATSPSTHQSGLITISDVTATLLSVAGVTPAAPMTGVAVHRGDGASVKALVSKDERSSFADYVRTRFIWLVVALHAGAALLALWRPSLRASIACVLLSLVPASFLMMLVPWWRWGVTGAVVASMAPAAVLAYVLTRVTRGDVRLLVGLAAAVGTAVLGIDAVLGGPLEIDAPFGNSPIGGGRFYGVGNIPYAYLVATLLLVGALALERWGQRAARWVAVALAAGLVVDGAPWFGADAGGVVAAAPAFAGLMLGYKRGRPSLRRLAPIFFAGLAIVGLFAVIDTLRPSTNQTHLTHALQGSGLGETAARKADRAMATVKTPLANIIVVGIAVLIAARPRLDAPALRAAAWALVIVAVAGSALNDSGLQIAAAVSAVSWPAYLAVGSEA